MRFMRLKSLGVSGFASGSASAPAITSASGIVRNGSRGLPVFLEVVVLLIFGCSSSAVYSHPLAALGVGHKYQGALDHADQGEALLAVVLAVIDLANAAGSANARRARSKETPCLTRFSAALSSSHSKSASSINILLTSSRSQGNESRQTKGCVSVVMIGPPTVRTAGRPTTPQASPS